ncbi:hypothetical protein I5L79_15770 [Hymenobacter sp. BT594]|uniref:Winged helix-turn-helix domain-containing protein n=2 Tax=Hymenobacter guriensis TaxID=2793065 RepID=A0ABS0L4J4_9BACT|nr:hypothetical protein [Hymenobacter guriensis]
MSQPIYFTLLLADDAPAEQRPLVEAYWSLDNGAFVHKVGELAAAHGMTLHELQKVSRQYAHVRVFLGNCLGCGDDLVQAMHSRHQLQQALQEFAPRRCAECQARWERRQEFERRLAAGHVGNPLGENAQALRRWEQLPEPELALLRTIVQLKTKRAIFAHLQPQLQQNPQQVWSLINSLEARHLVTTERAYDRTITGFRYAPELESLWTPDPALKPDPRTGQQLRLEIVPVPSKHAHYLPDFAGAFVVAAPVHLVPGTRYAYTGWLNTRKKTITLELGPLAEMEYYPGPDFTRAEPELLANLLERFTDELPQSDPSLA